MIYFESRSIRYREGVIQLCAASDGDDDGVDATQEGDGWQRMEKKTKTKEGQRRERRDEGQPPQAESRAERALSPGEERGVQSFLGIPFSQA